MDKFFIYDVFSQGNSSDENENKRRKKIALIARILILCFLSIIFLAMITVLVYFLYIRKRLNDEFMKAVDLEYTNYLDSKEHGPLNKDLIHKKMTYYAYKNKVTIFKGPFENCKNGRCKSSSGRFVHNWQLDKISEMLQGSDSIDLDEEYETINKYNEFLFKYKSHFKTIDDYEKSYRLFKKNRKLIEEHNKNEDRLFNLEYNEFTDFTNLSSFSSGIPIRKKLYDDKVISGLLRGTNNQEIHVDWRREGFVTDVMIQGNCGSCWAMASADIFSSFVSIKKRKLVTFSYQQILDCASNGFNCQGGSPLAALEYIRKNGICLNSEYKYKASKGVCRINQCGEKHEIKDIKNLMSEDTLNFLKTKGPFLTTLNLSDKFRLYGDGIYDESCDAGVLHAVVVVGHGYDKIKKVDYWIVKNSWGRGWGENGYIRILDSTKMKGEDKKKYCDIKDRSIGII